MDQDQRVRLAHFAISLSSIFNQLLFAHRDFLRQPPRIPTKCLGVKANSTTSGPETRTGLAARSATPLTSIFSQVDCEDSRLFRTRKGHRSTLLQHRYNVPAALLPL